MKDFDIQLCEIVKKSWLNADVVDLEVYAPEFAGIAKPGQFADIRIPGRSLRRPISIARIDPNAGTLRFVFQIRGAGTKELAAYKEEDQLDLLAPLGNGFPLLKDAERVLLVGGGIGTPPLLELAAHYGNRCEALLGYQRAASVILEHDFASYCAVEVATDDGSYGYHGLVTEQMQGKSYDAVYACGPAPMLKAVSLEAAKQGADCYVSLEERMACGVGACVGCAVMLIDDSGQEYYGRVCRDGPVFQSRQLAAFR